MGGTRLTSALADFIDAVIDLGAPVPLTDLEARLADRRVTGCAS
ncbi:hypothetical protein [Nonomuraea sp. NPDC049646]